MPWKKNEFPLAAAGFHLMCFLGSPCELNLQKLCHLFEMQSVARELKSNLRAPSRIATDPIVVLDRQGTNIITF